MKITGYESDNGNVTAITVTDETRGFYDKRFEPERPHGEWIDVTEYCGEFRCSACNFLCVTNIYRFCPNCGADMRKEGEEK